MDMKLLTHDIDQLEAHLLERYVPDSERTEDDRYTPEMYKHMRLSYMAQVFMKAAVFGFNDDFLGMWRSLLEQAESVDGRYKMRDLCLTWSVAETMFSMEIRG